MAACGLRNIRYVAFPPVVFETPAPAATPEPLPAPETDPAPMMAEPSPPSAPELQEVAGAPLPAEPTTSMPPAPVTAEAGLAASSEPPPAALLPPTPFPASARPGMRRLAEFDAEVAAQLTRPRRGAPADGPPPSVVNEADAPAGAVPVRNYALLRDIAGELRPRRGRARGGKRA